MARLFLIRHGQPSQTWGEAAGDPGLSDLGLKQAEAAARDLSALGSLAVVSSPMRRCIETAAPYAAMRCAKPAVEPRVSEVAASHEIEDRAAWLQARFPWRDPQQSRSWASLEPELQQWRDRMLDYVRAIGKDTAVFSHFIAINAIVGAALQREETFVCMPGHASITEIEVADGRLELVAIGAQMQVDDVR